jgi:glycosyltransferase involved in cell wall biosynthesis
MKIAFISYEFPPDTGFGGIGTYTYQVALALGERGHYVEIFSCSPLEEKLKVYLNDRIMLHRVKAARRSVFSKLVVDIFKQRNEVINFDIIESPEYCAEGIEVRKAFPSIPMVVKLHTPIFLVNKLNNFYTKTPLKKRIKKILGRKNYNKDNDPDYQLARSADAVCSPSVALAEILKKEWDLDKIDVIPNLFIPRPTYLNIPISENDCKIITYIGRLDVRKGIKSLIEAIPIVLRKKPGIKFRFIGGDGEAPNGGSMKAYIVTFLHKYIHQLEFTGYLKSDEIPNYITDTGIFVFPSIWENYPCVCLEAMSAGKAIIASKNGGMKEMLGDVKGGILIDPLNSKEIAGAIISLVSNPKGRIEMGMTNREKMKAFSGQTLEKAESYYNRIIGLN